MPTACLARHFIEHGHGRAGFVQTHVQSNQAELVVPVEDVVRTVGGVRFSNDLQCVAIASLRQEDSAALTQNLWMIGIFRIRLFQVVPRLLQPIPTYCQIIRSRRLDGLRHTRLGCENQQTKGTQLVFAGTEALSWRAIRKSLVTDFDDLGVSLGGLIENGQLQKCSEGFAVNRDAFAHLRFGGMKEFFGGLGVPRHFRTCPSPDEEVRVGELGVKKRFVVAHRQTQRLLMVVRRFLNPLLRCEMLGECGPYLRGIGRWVAMRNQKSAQCLLARFRETAGGAQAGHIDRIIHDLGCEPGRLLQGREPEIPVLRRLGRELDKRQSLGMAGIGLVVGGRVDGPQGDRRFTHGRPAPNLIVNPGKFEQRAQQLMMGGQQIGLLHECIPPGTDGVSNVAVFQKHVPGRDQMIDVSAFLVRPLVVKKGLAPFARVRMLLGDDGQLAWIALLKVPEHEHGKGDHGKKREKREPDDESAVEFLASHFRS